MIQKVGFKNFRRFKNFPEMDLGDINIFVGRNNAGKSTVLKALQLMKGNMNTLSRISNRRSRNIFEFVEPMFVFDVDELAELHIDNFDKALYNKAERREITLSVTVDGCSFTIVLDGQIIKGNNYYVAVPYNYIELKDDTIHITFNLQTRALHLELKAKGNSNQTDALDQIHLERERVQHMIQDCQQMLRKITAKLHVTTSDQVITPEEMFALVSERQEIEKKLMALRKNLEELNKKAMVIAEMHNQSVIIDIKSMPIFRGNQYRNIIDRIFTDLFNFAATDSPLDKRTKEYKSVEMNRHLINDSKLELTNASNRFQSALLNFNLEYIHAHAASQKVIYLKEDKMDVLSHAISEFCKARIMPGDKEWTFIKKWMSMDRFGIGDDFRIDNIQNAGAGYMLKIIEGGKEMDLSDKGTGSIQVMTLLFSLAVIMQKVNQNIFSFFPTILIEEPEQNIHPMLQSMLADMFVDYWQSINTGINKSQLIIETHSEYLIRRTQVLVAIEDYKDKDEILHDSPFRLFYFKSGENGVPYELHYNTDGSFDKPFDEGFFDAAGNSQLQLMKIARRKK